MKVSSTNGLVITSLLLMTVTVAVCVSCVAQVGAGQDQLPAPPPMRAVAEADRTVINQAGDSKSRIKKTIELATAHLQRAEAAANQQEYDLSLRELGHYLGLLEDAFKFLSKLNKGESGKNRDLYKYIELALRAHGPRLTVMRRATPIEYATRMKEVEESARESRTDALNAFYGHTVVRDGPKPEEKNKPKDIPPNPER